MLGEDISWGRPLQLAFAEPMHGFIALDDPQRRVEGSKPEAGIHAVLAKPMILFPARAHILTVSALTAFRQYTAELESLEGQGRYGVLVDSPPAWARRAARASPLPAQLCGGLTGGAQPAV